ncbi:hypothetical protein F5888DRAFT_1737803 [Russula emetica]|nr:hypothetical protein F5888DRAFT_1737803 [Russula emetica]
MGTLLTPLICIHEAPPSWSKSTCIRSGGLSLMRVPQKCYHHLKRDLKPGEGAEPEQHDATQRPTRLKPPDHAGGVWWESTPLILDCPQLALAVEMGNVKAPNPCTVEAKRKAKWPPRGQATEQKHGPDQQPREVLYECDPNVLKRTGTCKPEECRSCWASEVKTWYIEGEPSWEGLVDPQGPHFEATEPRLRASSPAEREDTLYRNQITLGHSCSAYPRSF